MSRTRLCEVRIKLRKRLLTTVLRVRFGLRHLGCIGMSLFSTRANAAHILRRPAEARAVAVQQGSLARECQLPDQGLP